jgi:Double-GTPase 2
VWVLVGLGLVLYVTLCVVALIAVTVPALLVLAPAAAAAGAVGAWVLIASAFTGVRADRQLPADEGVAPHVLGGEPAAVEPAWRHYLGAQWWRDADTAAERVRGGVVGCWRWLHGRTRAAVDDLLLVLWPFVPVPYVVGAALTAGVAVASASAAVVVGVPAGVVGLLRAACARVLRRRERSRQHRSVSAATCTASGCDDVTTLPVVECACGRRHHRLEPGDYGVVRRRCTCGLLLPSTVSRAAQSHQLRCRRCDRRLLPGAMIGADVRVAVLGAPGAGRSRFVRDGVAALETALTSAGGGLERLSPPEDPPEDCRTCVSVRVSAGRRVGTVHVYDPVGDALDVPAQRRRLHHLRHAQGFALVVDGAALPRHAARTRRDPVDPEPTYRAVVQHLADDQADLRRAALAVVLAGAPSGDGPSSGASSDVRRWLVSAGVDNLVSAADRDFGSVRYFLLDDPLLDDPTAAGTALSWLLGRAGLRVPAAGTP